MRGLAAAFTAGMLATCQTASAETPDRATPFDGAWAGRNVVEQGSDCRPSPIYGAVRRGRVRLEMTNIGAALAGEIAADGSVTLKDDEKSLSYAFFGQAEGGEIKGRWRADGGLCTGTWRLRRTS